MIELMIKTARETNSITTHDMRGFTYVAVPAVLVTEKDPWLSLVPMFSLYLAGDDVYVLKAPEGWRP